MLRNYLEGASKWEAEAGSSSTSVCLKAVWPEASSSLVLSIFETQQYSFCDSTIISTVNPLHLLLGMSRWSTRVLFILKPSKGWHSKTEKSLERDHSDLFFPWVSLLGPRSSQGSITPAASCPGHPVFPIKNNLTSSSSSPVTKEIYFCCFHFLFLQISFMIKQMLLTFIA